MMDRDDRAGRAMLVFTVVELVLLWTGLVAGLAASQGWLSSDAAFIIVVVTAGLSVTALPIVVIVVSKIYDA